jgi:hypothetical protein
LPPLSNSQLSIANPKAVDCRRSQRSFDEARSKCHGDGALAATQIFANLGPEAEHPPAFAPATTKEESDEDAPAELFNSEEEDQFASYIFAPDHLTTSTASTSGGSGAHLHSEEKFENSHWCGTCGASFREDQIEEHLISKKHMRHMKRTPQPNRKPETPVSNSVQWRGPVSVFTAVVVLLIACHLATPVVVSMHVDGEFLLDTRSPQSTRHKRVLNDYRQQPQAQARLAERPTLKSEFSVLETPAGGSSTIEIPQARADTQDFGLPQSSP